MIKQFLTLKDARSLRIKAASYRGTLRFFICYHLLSVIIDKLEFIYSLKELCFKLLYLAKEKSCGVLDLVKNYASWFCMKTMFLN